MEKILDTKLLNAYERGIDDGVLHGVMKCLDEEIYDKWTDAQRHAYRCGYDHGVALYCEIEGIN